MRTQQIIGLFFFMSLLAMGIGFGVGKYFSSSEAFFNSLHPTTTVFPKPQLLAPFSLTDHQGRQVNLFTFAKKWSFLFFGYTYCPDVCPNTLVILKQVYEELVHHSDVLNTQVLFISVDPQRDTLEQLATYTSYFNKNFLGVTGAPDQIATLAHPLGITYFRTSSENKNYLIDHSATILLIDPLLRLRASFLPPHHTETILSDFRKIRQYYAEECCFPSAKMPAKN